ncbi:MAG: hypothetical protein ACUVWR_02090 [Anaerolineae bacterium]
MVTASTLREDVEINLQAVDAELDILPQRLEDMDHYGNWAGNEWMNIMARFEWLAELANQGKLDTGEMARYRELLQLLHKHYVLTVQLDLPVPELVLREAERLVGKPLDRAA